MRPTTALSRPVGGPGHTERVHGQPRPGLSPQRLHRHRRRQRLHAERGHGQRRLRPRRHRRRQHLHAQPLRVRAGPVADRDGVLAQHLGRALTPRRTLRPAGGMASYGSTARAPDRRDGEREQPHPNHLARGPTVEVGAGFAPERRRGRGLMAPRTSQRRFGCLTVTPRRCHLPPVRTPLAALLVMLVASASARAVPFSDGDFAPADWEPSVPNPSGHESGMRSCSLTKPSLRVARRVPAS